jgi:transposase
MQNASLETQKASLEAENQQLRKQVEWLRKAQFGRKSETKKVIYPEEQMSLFNEAEIEAKPSAPEPEVTVKPHKRKKKVGHREEMLAKLPHQKIVVEPETTVCLECGSELSPVGEEFVRSEVVYIPARVEVKDFYRKSYECRECRKQGQPTMLKAAMPQPVIPHSIASPSVVAHVMMQKYGYAIPLYRQESEWKHIGLAFSRANLANWIIIASNEWLMPIYDRMHELLLEERCLHVDETPVQVHHEKDRKNKSKSYMWVYTSTALNPQRHIRLFEYAPTRSAHCAETFLEGFAGYLLTDDYVGYNRVETAVHCLCWAHARRKFVDAAPPYAKKADGFGDSLVKKGIDQIGDLFKKEKEYKALSPKERYERRLGEEKPILKALFEWAEDNVDKLLPKSPLAKAMNYLLSNREGLTCYLKDGHCDISNNTAENSIRPFTVGRKNWLFSNSPKGAKASAIVYSLIETAKANNLDSERYLKYLFEQLPNTANFKNAETLDQYLPWAVKVQEKCKV